MCVCVCVRVCVCVCVCVSSTKATMADLLICLYTIVSASDEYNWTELHAATQQHDSKTICELLAKGSDINWPDSFGDRPLHLAVGHPDLVELLLKMGADANLANNEGYLPLHLATEKGVIASIEILVKDSSQWLLSSVWKL